MRRDSRSRWDRLRFTITAVATSPITTTEDAATATIMPTELDDDDVGGGGGLAVVPPDGAAEAAVPLGFEPSCTSNTAKR